MAKKTTPDNLVCRSRKAARRFQVFEQLECGIALAGSEVKSLRERAVSIEEAYARIIDDELWLIGCHIAAYKFSQAEDHQPLRRRKLLVHASELRRLNVKVEQKGLTLVPLKVYFNSRGVAKVSLALARGKKFADKREDLKARDHQREIKRAMRRKR